MNQITLQPNELSQPIRLDNFLNLSIPKYSRTYFQKMIEGKYVKVNGQIATKSSIIIKNFDVIELTFPEIVFPNIENINHALDVKILYENNEFLIVYKPANLIMHKASNLPNVITLVDWLINKFAYIKNVGANERPGIVHRLDKNTTGILIVPKTNYSHAIFTDMFKNRKIEKTYLAIVKGHPPRTGVIDYPITRDTVEKHKMSHKHAYGRESITEYSVIEYLNDSALVSVLPRTGRTHQIRVHFAAIGHPLIGDVTYGTKSPEIDRQALHAYKLSFMFENTVYTFWWDMPEDMRNLANILK